MSTVFDVAKYILEKKGRISTWKLQKLCYYAQAWSLAWTGMELFAEDFEAWSNGPVCRVLFAMHKGKYSVEACDISGNVSTLSPDQKETIDIVLNEYGDMQPYELREQTHAEKPWCEARGNLPLGTRSQEVISKSSMTEYYGGL